MLDVCKVIFPVFFNVHLCIYMLSGLANTLLCPLQKFLSNEHFHVIT